MITLICKHGHHYRSDKKVDNKQQSYDSEKNTGLNINTYRENCSYKIYAIIQDGKWVISKVNYDHDHSIKREPHAYAINRKLYRVLLGKAHSL